ncbi:hypothetical protein V7968_21420 [Nocardia vulneris]|uniref:hypothetical protein n=1 Tax=Nocardia vulneris TaxID=1141657 RepID=UPI0030D56176
MVSSQHEAMHRIFQYDPGTFARAFRALELPFPDPLEVIQLSVDLTECRPVERRADTILQIDTAEGPFLLLVEAQGKRDPTRPPAWAYYLSYLQARYELLPVLVVICQDHAVASWAEGPLPVGHDRWPSLILRPLVLGPHNVRPVTDIDTAVSDLALATLSAITHAKQPDITEILETLAKALSKTGPTEAAHMYRELTELGLGAGETQQMWRKLMSMDLDFFRSQTSEDLRAQGEVRGEAKGEARGLIKGQAEGRAECIVRMLDRRGIPLSDMDRNRILTCLNIEVLDRWFDRSISATTAEEVLADDH